MRSEPHSASMSPPSPDQKLVTSQTSETLTPSELARLQHAGTAADASLQKAFPGLRIVKD